MYTLPEVRTLYDGAAGIGRPEKAVHLRLEHFKIVMSHIRRAQTNVVHLGA